MISANVSTFALTVADSSFLAVTVARADAAFSNGGHTRAVNELRSAIPDENSKHSPLRKRVYNSSTTNGNQNHVDEGLADGILR